MYEEEDVLIGIETGGGEDGRVGEVNILKLIFEALAASITMILFLKFIFPLKNTSAMFQIRELIVSVFLSPLYINI